MQRQMTGKKKKEDIKMIIERFEPFKVIKNLLKS